MAIELFDRVVPNVGAPTLDADGNPVAWTQGSPTRTDWGDPRVWIDGADRTEFRKAGYRTTWPERWTYVKPFWFGEATIVVSKVRSYETPPSWCAVGKEVRIRKRLPDGVTYSTDPRDEWRGKVVRVAEGDNKTTVLEVTGWFQTTDWFVRAPGLSSEPVEIGVQIQGNLDTTTRNYPWRPNNPSTVTTGKTTTLRGQWETVGEYLVGIGSAIPGYTYRPDANFVPQLIDTVTSPGTTFVGRHGAPGVEVDELVSDLRASPNVIYVTGNVNGIPWELGIPNAGTMYFAPISASKKVHTLFWNDTTGSLTEDTSEFDVTVPRIEVHWALPAGMTYAQAKVIADEYRTRVETPGYTGRIRLSSSPSSPAGAHLLDIRPDDLYTLQGYRGADRPMGVGEVAFNWNGGQPTADLAVDSNKRDLATIEAILNGDIDLAVNPFHRVQAGKTSALRDDRKAKWSADAGSGYVPNDETNGRRHKNAAALWTITLGQWNEYIVLASERDSITDSRIVVSTDGTIGTAVGKRFVAIVTDRTVALPPNALSPLPTNPLANGVMDAAVEDAALGCQMSWGGSFKDGSGAYVVNAVGYGNIAYKAESLGDTVTGEMRDQSDWPFVHSDPSVQPGAARLVLYVYAPGVGTAKCWAQFVKGPEA